MKLHFDRRYITFGTRPMTKYANLGDTASRPSEGCCGIRVGVISGPDYSECALSPPLNTHTHHHTIFTLGFALLRASLTVCESNDQRNGVKLYNAQRFGIAVWKTAARAASIACRQSELGLLTVVCQVKICLRNVRRARTHLNLYWSIMASTGVYTQ